MSSSTQMLPLEAPRASGNLVPLPPWKLTDLEIEQNGWQSGTNQAQAIEIVQPPPKIKTMIHRTARFIAKKGSRFESRILASNVDSDIFNFLRSSDPCHAFYQQKVTEYLARPTKSEIQPDEGEDHTQPVLDVSRKPLRLRRITLPLPEGMTPQELNTVRLTAYYAARYGKYLLADLAMRVIKCSQFGFLNPTDSRFYYFSQLVDEYSRMLTPPTCFRKLPRDIIVDTPLKLETFFDCLERDVQAPPLP